MSNMNRKRRRSAEAAARQKNKVLAEERLGEVSAALMSARLQIQSLETQLMAAVEGHQRMSVYLAGLILNSGGSVVVPDAIFDKLDAFGGIDIEREEDPGPGTVFALSLAEPTEEEQEMLDRVAADVGEQLSLEEAGE